MSLLVVHALTRLLGNDTDGEPTNPDLPPGAPPTRTFEGPWFTTQLAISLALGIFSFVVFSYCRTKWPVLFAPRTKLRGFSPHEAHTSATFGWILPTIRTSELAVLQIVGLDAAVLLSFFKMSFYLFSAFSVLAAAIIMPVNYSQNMDLGDGPDDDDWPMFRFTNAPTNDTNPPPSWDQDWLDLLNDANSYLTLHLIFTYIFTALTLRFIHTNYRRFIRARQLFSLELVHSIPARTIMLTRLPNHLQHERQIAVYFENMDLRVESVSLCREVGALNKYLDDRTKWLLKLEEAWVNYVGNPSTIEEYDPSDPAVQPLIDVDPEAQTPTRLVVPSSKRPTLRPHPFGPQVDAIDYLEGKFKEADEKVQKKRKSGKFKSTHVAFVTFEKMSSAQIACQTAHASKPSESKACLAPEPRDIVWANMHYTPGARRVREWFVMFCMMLLLLFWFFPISALASLLSYEEIKKIMPWLGRLIDANENIRAIVQNSLPSVVMITLNACLPFILEGLTYVQGLRARSWIEYSMLKKYYLMLLVNVVFVFMLASTYWQLIRELADSPAKIPEKVAMALQVGKARHFFLSYVILQGLGIMPLQLLNLGVILPQLAYRIFTRTPRDYAELNAPPMVNYGVVYPQAILIFTITLLYSIIQPLIVFFGAAYFGIAYVVYKYKLLFVFYKPYESQGQAWPITFTRLIWGVFIFQIFMTGMFLLKKSFIIASLMSPLLVITLIWAWHIHKTYKPLSDFVSLSSVCEVERGEDEDVVRLRGSHPVSWSQSNLNHRRYAQNDETLYVAPEDDRTDYSQPPMANWYPGVLNTGKRRYGHPALTGVLPQPWLPLKKGHSLRNGARPGSASRQNTDQAVVLTLRKRYSKYPGDAQRRASQMIPQPPDFLTGNGPEDANGAAAATNEAPPSLSTSTTSTTEGGTSDANSVTANPWRNARRPRAQTVQSAPPLAHRLSFDPASGVITLPDNGDWLVAHDDSDSEGDYGTLSNSSIAHSPDLSGAGTSADANNTPTAGTPAGSTSQNAASSSSLSSKQQRRGTYYHHPEKRRKAIPGDLTQPAPSSSP